MLIILTIVVLWACTLALGWMLCSAARAGDLRPPRARPRPPGITGVVG